MKPLPLGGSQGRFSWGLARVTTAVELAEMMDGTTQLASVNQPMQLVVWFRCVYVLGEAFVPLV